MISNTVVLASERCLDAQHPIRRLVKPHTYGTAHVNLLGAVTLAPYGGIASRLFGTELFMYVRIFICIHIFICVYLCMCMFECMLV